MLHLGKTEFSIDGAAYINRCETDNTGDYSFEFIVNKLAGEYTLAMNSCALNNKQIRSFSFMNYIPEIAVSIVDGSRDSLIAGNEITLSQQVEENVDKIKVIYMNSLTYSSLCASYDIK